MKILLLIICSYFSVNSFAQVIIDPEVKHRYLTAYNKLPKDTRDNIESLADEAKKEGIEFDSVSMPSFAIIQKFVTDTINRKSLKKKAFKLHETRETLLLCGALYNDDSLVIEIGMGGQDSYIGLHHIVKGTGVKTIYDEYREYDSSFAKSPGDARQDNIMLPSATNKFVLSDSVFAEGKTIYGYCSITTDVFYKDDDNFKEGYIKQRILVEALFKCVLNRKKLPGKGT